MKKILMLIAMLMLIPAMSQAAGVMLIWQNDTTLSDVQRSRLETIIEVGVPEATGGVSWSALATVTSGAEKWSGNLPSSIPSGASIRFRAKAVLDGNSSDYCSPVPRPASPGGLGIFIQ